MLGSLWTDGCWSSEVVGWWGVGVVAVPLRMSRMLGSLWTDEWWGVGVVGCWDGVVLGC